MLVEAREDSAGLVPAAVPSAPADPQVAATPPVDADSDEDVLPASPMTMQDGIRAVLTAFGGAATPPRWPMYVRQAKQFLCNAVDGFDEKHYGFASVVDLLRAAGKAGVLRVERDRQGAVRVFAGPKLTAPSSAAALEATTIVDAAVVDIDEAEPVVAAPVAEPPVIDAETTAEAGAVAVAGAAAPKKVVRRRKAVKPKSTGGVRKAAKPAKPRARKTVRAEPAAADVRE